MNKEAREEMLNRIGALGGPEAVKRMSDGDWVQLIAFLSNDGFVKSLDWDTPMGLTIAAVIDEMEAEANASNS